MNVVMLVFEQGPAASAFHTFWVVFVEVESVLRTALHFRLTVR